MVFLSLWTNAHLNCGLKALFLQGGNMFLRNKKRASKIDISPPLSCLNDSDSGDGDDSIASWHSAHQNIDCVSEKSLRLSLILMLRHEMSQRTLLLKRLLTSCSRKFYLITPPQQPQRKFILTIFHETFIKMLIRWIHNGDNIWIFSRSVLTTKEGWMSQNGVSH